MTFAYAGRSHVQGGAVLYLCWRDRTGPGSASGAQWAGRFKGAMAVQMPGRECCPELGGGQRGHSGGPLFVIALGSMTNTTHVTETKAVRRPPCSQGAHKGLGGVHGVSSYLEQRVPSRRLRVSKTERSPRDVNRTAAWRRLAPGRPSPQCSFWHLIRKNKTTKNQLAINTQSWTGRFSAGLGSAHLITRFLTARPRCS